MTTLPKFYGFNKSSDAGKDMFCPSLFTKGCNFKCPYCMNPRLVKGRNLIPVSLAEVESFIKEAKPEMVMISGGEPTMDFDNLNNAIDWLNGLGCKVGLSTNGSKAFKDPENFTSVISRVNYVALDLKGNGDTYKEIYYEWGIWSMAYALAILRNRRKNDPTFDYEVRTTLYRKFINENILVRLAALIFEKEDRWVLQQFRITNEILDPRAKNVVPYTEEEANKLLDLAKTYSKANVELRYV